MNGKHIGWFIVTTGMITALPLIFEVSYQYHHLCFLLNLYELNFFICATHQVKREAMVEEMEKMQIGAALQEGRSPQELAASGMTAAIEPAVLK